MCRLLPSELFGSIPTLAVLPNMTIFGLPFYLYVVITATAWLFHAAEIQLMYQPLTALQRGWSKKQKKVFEKSVYERDRILPLYACTGFCQW